MLTCTQLSCSDLDFQVATPRPGVQCIHALILTLRSRDTARGLERHRSEPKTSRDPTLPCDCRRLAGINMSPYRKNAPFRRHLTQAILKKYIPHRCPLASSLTPCAHHVALHLGVGNVLSIQQCLTRNVMKQVSVGMKTAPSPRFLPAAGPVHCTTSTDRCIIPDIKIGVLRVMLHGTIIFVPNFPHRYPGPNVNHGL